MTAEHMTLPGKAWLVRASVRNALLGPREGLVVKPVAAALKYGFPNARESDPAVVVPGDRGHRSKRRDSANELTQGGKTRTPVHEVSAQQNDVGTFPGNDLQDSLEHLLGAVLLQMKIAGKENSPAKAEMVESLTPHHQGSACSYLQRFDTTLPDAHSGNRIRSRVIARSHTMPPANLSGTTSSR